MARSTHRIAALVLMCLGLGLGTAPGARASSHREAPLIAGDPLADNLDTYAFRSPNRPGTITFVGTWFPLEEPAGGPNFYRFGDDVRYTFYVDNNGDARPDIGFHYRFHTTYQRKNTFLYNDGPITSLTDPHFNVRQTYTLTRTDYAYGHAVREVVLGSNLPVPPANIGPKSTPNYAGLSNAAIHELAGGYRSWAGQSDDPFFVDLGAVFDLLTIRNGAPGNTGGGKDAVAGYNCQTIALQVPIAALTPGGTMPANADDPHAIIGMWSVSSRRGLSVLGRGGEGDEDGQGQNEQSWRGGSGWREVSRLGMPLVNEVVIPLEDKDTWNSSEPKDDAQFLSYVQHSEVAGLLNLLYGLPVPPEPRNDLVSVFLTGIDLRGLGVPLTNKPANVVPSEMIRLNMMTPVAAQPNAFGALGGDVQGFPNGRRLSDDVVDVELRAIAGVLEPLFGSSFTPPAIAGMLGDGVDANDLPFREGFPYVALPHEGFANAKGVLFPVHPPAAASHLGTMSLPNVKPAAVRTDLAQNSPNPFAPSTRIHFSLAAGGAVSLKIYDVQGREVRTLLDGAAAAGEHDLVWDGANASGRPASAGMYFYRLVVGGQEIQKKMILAR